MRDRLAATRDTIPGGLAFYEVADRIRLLDFSDAAADMIGYTREEYQARTLDDALAVVHPEDRARVEAVAAELDAGASRSSCTMRVLRGDGKVAWLHLSASTMYRDETALYVVAVLIDVTNEKENEQRLKAQSELQCRLSDSVPCGIVRYTVDDEPRVLFVNRTGCEIFGYADFAAYRAGTAGGKIVPIHDDDDELHAKTVAALKAGAAPIGFTYRFVRSDGSMGWIEGTSALERDIDGRTVVQSAFPGCVRPPAEALRTGYTPLFDGVVLGVRRDRRVRWREQDVPLAVLVGQDARRQNHAHGRGAQVLDRPSARAGRSLAPTCRDRRMPCRRRRQPIACTYRMAFEDRSCWYQSILLRVSESAVLCCSKDVTEHVSNEDRRIMMRVLDTMGKLPVGVGVFAKRDGEVRLRYANDRLSTMFGDGLPGAPDNPDWDAPLELSEEVKRLDQRCVDQESSRMGTNWT